MKILEIDEGNGYFRTSPDVERMAVDLIDKDGLMKLLALLLETEVRMDDPEQLTLSNQVHLIIYKSIYTKFKTLETNKSKFKDEADKTYFTALQKYAEA